MANDDCKFLLDDIEIDPKLRSIYWSELMELLKETEQGRASLSKSDRNKLIDSFTDDFFDREKRIQFSQVIIRSYRNEMLENLKRDPGKFLEELPSEIELERRILTSEGLTLIEDMKKQMSDKGTKFTLGELDDEISEAGAKRAKDTKYRHPNDDVMLGVEIIEKLDKWLYDQQVIYGMATEKLPGHLLKYGNDRAIIAMSDMDEWIADQIEFRKKDSYGDNFSDEEIYNLLKEEFVDHVSGNVTNSVRPNRLMSRGVRLKDWAILRHNRKYGTGSSYTSIVNSIRRTANEAALQKNIPVDAIYQKGLDIRSIDSKIQKIMKADNLSKKEAESIALSLETAGRDQISVHVRELDKRIGEVLEDVKKEINSLKDKKQEMFKSGATEKEINKINNDIKKLENLEKDYASEGRENILTEQLDPFIGRETLKDPSKAGEAVDLFAAEITSQLIFKGPIASIQDAGTQYARNMEAYGDSPTNALPNFIKAIKKVFYTTGSGIPKVGKLIGADQRALILKDQLKFVISQEQALLDMLGVNDPLSKHLRVKNNQKLNVLYKKRDSLLKKKAPKGAIKEVADKISKLEKENQKNARWALKTLLDASFFVNGITHMNQSSFNGSVDIELDILSKALMEKLPVREAAHTYMLYGFSEKDILKLRDVVNGSTNKTLNLNDLSNDVLLFNKVRKGIARESWGTTPANDISTERALDKVHIFGKSTKRGDSPLRKSLINAHRGLIRTGVSAVLKTYKRTYRSVDIATYEGKKQALNRTTQILGVFFMLSGLKEVVYEMMRTNQETGDKVGTDIFDNERLGRAYTRGALSFEFFGLFRDVFKNLAAEDAQALVQNTLGPTFGAAAGLLQGLVEIGAGLGEVATDIKSWEEQEFLSTSKKRRFLKKVIPFAKHPLIDSVVDEYIIEAFLYSLNPEGLETWKLRQIERDQRDLQRWQNIEGPIDIGGSFRYLMGVDE